MTHKPIHNYIKYLIEECYKEDYDPYYAENWLDNYCYQYTFSEWYFLYRRKMKLHHQHIKLNEYPYKNTPVKLIIGSAY